MLPSKAKSGLSEGSNNMNTREALKVGKLTRTSSTKSDTRSASPKEKLSSTMPKPHASVDRSLKSAKSKIASKNSSTPEKLPRAAKASEMMQERLDAAEMDLKRATEQLASVEQEKIKAIEDLNEAKKLADEANEKLREATVARKRAEESLEVEKFWVNELEHASKEAAQKREEQFQQELESVRSRHNQDVSALSSMTLELQKIKVELTDATNAKETALGQADAAKKSAEIFEEKVEILSEEVSRLKALHDSKLDYFESTLKAAEMIKKLDAKVSTLKAELERAKIAEEKLVQMEALVEKLQIEATDARNGESDASKLADEWRNKAEMLKADLEEAYESEKSASDSLAAMMLRLEESKSLFEDAESEIATIQGKMESLENELAKQKIDLEESDKQLDLAQQDAMNIGKTVELLKLELQKLEEEKLQAVNSEKVAASKVNSLMEENSKLIGDLRLSKEEGEKAKKEMEGLALALQAMSTEVREKEERLLSTQAEIEDSQKKVEHLNAVLRNTKERYEVMLDEARYEIVCLKKSAERFETEEGNSSNNFDAKQLNFVNTISKLEEEIALLKAEMTRMVDSQNAAKQETGEAKADVADMITKLRQVESGASSAYEEAEESKYESLQLKETLLDKENELHGIAQENDDLRAQEAATLKKAKELSALLKEATAEETEENGEISNGEKEHNLENGRSEVPFKKLEEHHNEDQKQKEENRKATKNDEEDAVEFMGNGFASDRDHDLEESIDDDLESKMNGDSLNLTDGMRGGIGNGTTKQNQNQKKKKALLHKFGNLLKKGNH